MSISKAIGKYGVESFIIEEIDSANNLCELNRLEAHYVRKLNSLNRNFGYNVRHGGENSQISEETKKKLSEIAKKRIKNGNAKKVINTETGKIYDSATNCWEENKNILGISVNTFRDKLRGSYGNNTSFRYLDEKYKSVEFTNNGRKKVINIETGKIYESISETAKTNGINRITLNYKLLNQKKNDTAFRYLENY